MRDARRIREREEDGTNGRLGVLALAALGVVVISYNVGLQVGMSRVAPGPENTTTTAAPLAKLDQAQQKHDAMQFYTRLNQEAPKAALEAVPEVPDVAQDPQPAVELRNDNIDAVPDEPVPPAETAQGAIARLGKSSNSVEPVSLDSQGNFTVQVSAFQTQEEADAYRASLGRKGYQPYVVAAEIPGKGMWYRVRVGRFEDKSAANEAKAKLALANIPSFVVAAH